MDFQIGASKAQQATRADIQGMHLEEAFLLVSFKRLENTTAVLKDQLADLQEQNAQLGETSDLLSLARNLMAKLGDGAQSDASFPDGPELKAFLDAAAEAGFDASGITNKGELNATIENFKTRVDSLTKTQQIALLHVQSTMNAYNEVVTSITNHLKGMHDLKTGILQKSY